MSGVQISPEDRQEIYDTLARYVWGMDTGDIAGVVATFTPDGVVKDVTGKRWDAAQGGARGFATHFLTRPNRRGGQHHSSILSLRKPMGAATVSPRTGSPYNGTRRETVNPFAPWAVMSIPALRWMANG